MNGYMNEINECMSGQGGGWEVDTRMAGSKITRDEIQRVAGKGGRRRRRVKGVVGVGGEGGGGLADGPTGAQQNTGCSRK